MNDTRERIVAAATVLCTEDPTTRPSVRVVAARAGVGASTLRYYFPTQRALFDAVLQTSFEQQYPDERIHDTTIPAGDRLRECLTNLLTPVGVGVQAREFWLQLLTFANTSESARAESAFTNIARVAGDRVESWLEVLEAEGAITPGHRARHAEFLLTLIDGLAIARALPSDDADRNGEQVVLQDAVTAVLRPTELDPVSKPPEMRPRLPE